MHFDKKVIPGNRNSVKTGRSTAWVAEAAGAIRAEAGIRGRGEACRHKVMLSFGNVEEKPS